MKHKPYIHVGNAPYKDKRPRAFIFLPKPNEVQSVILERRGITTISREAPDAKTELLEFLRELRDASK